MKKKLIIICIVILFMLSMSTIVNPHYISTPNHNELYTPPYNPVLTEAKVMEYSATRTWYFLNR